MESQGYGRNGAGVRCGRGEECGGVCVCPGKEKDHSWRALGRGSTEGGEDTLEVVLVKGRGISGW